MSKKISRLDMVIVVVVILTLVIVGALRLVINGGVKKYQGQIQEYVALVEQRIASKNIYQLAGSKVKELNTVSDTFPDESSIIMVMQKLESLVKKYDNNGTVKFAPQAQIKVNGQLGVSLVFTFKALPTEVISFLRELEKLPHVIEVTKLDLKTPEGVSNPAEVYLGVILYVQDPFTQPN